MAAEHVLLVVIDQADPEAIALLVQTGIDPAAVRLVALKTLSAPEDLPPIPMPPLYAAGTHDRPPLAIERVAADAWEVLCWRQEHLPLGHLKRQGDWGALFHLET